jgi:hypothetical protein
LTGALAFVVVFFAIEGVLIASAFFAMGFWFLLLLETIPCVWVSLVVLMRDLYIGHQLLDVVSLPYHIVFACAHGIQTMLSCLFFLPPIPYE